MLILYAAGVGLIGRPVVIRGRYNKCHSLQLKIHYAHFPPLQHTHTYSRKHNYAELVMRYDHGFRGIVCWPGKEAHWPLKGWIVKSAEHCGADYKPLDRLIVGVNRNIPIIF